MRRTVSLSSCFVIVILLMTGWAHAATFVVDSLDDLDNGNPYTPADGTNTLRKCIRLANNNSGGDTINFAVSGVISPGSSLPEVVDDGTIIDASSQWNGTWPEGGPGITLDGIGAGPGEDGLKIFGASDCQIRGLFIRNFGGMGVVIFGGAQLNTVGGTGMGERNVISGNGESGIAIHEPSRGNIVSGNFIGTDVDGMTTLGNSYSGVMIYHASTNTIGGMTESERNIISGNMAKHSNFGGVLIFGSGATENLVQGNYIGTNVTGTADLANWSFGVLVWGASNNTIGGTTAGERNVISGNGLGVGISDYSYMGTNYKADNNTVQGNYIGTDVTGVIGLGNSNAGVYIYGGSSNTIGGTTAGERNIISGNEMDGVHIAHGVGNIVQGNYIGTDVTGTADLGNFENGVVIGSSANNIIGGTTAETRNIISGNGFNGVEIRYSSNSGVTENLVQGNYIGTDVTGTADLGNYGAGVYIYNSPNNTIGGTTQGAGNTVAFNFKGILVIVAGTGESSAGNAFLSNSIFSNTDLGIDLGHDGVTPNDPGDSDIGANNLQNFPVITSANTNTISGTLDSTADTTFTISLYSNNTEDPSGYGEGEEHIGTTTCTTDSSGNGTWTLTVGGNLAGLAISSTATDPSGNTSEFSELQAVEQQNNPPTADAGPDQTGFAWFDGIAEVTLDGSGSSDPDGDALTYLWTWAIDGETYEATGVSRTIELPIGEHIIELVVNDGTQDSGPDEVIVDVFGPVPVDDLVHLTYGRMRFDRRTGLMSMDVGITNTSDRLLISPIGLVIESISDPSVTLANGDGTTHDGKKYIDLSELLDDEQLFPDDSVNMRLYFNNPSRRRFTFDPSVRAMILP